MNKNAKKITAIGLAGITAFSSVPASSMLVQNIYADEVVSVTADSFQPISFKVAGLQFKLSLDSGKFYYDAENSRFLFSYDSVFILDRPKDSSLTVTMSGGNLDVDSITGKYKLSIVKSQASLEVISGEVKEKISLLDIIQLGYPDVEELVFVAKPNLSDFTLIHSGYSYNGYLSKNSIFSVECKYDFTNKYYYKGLSIDEYDINVSLNGVNVPKSSLIIEDGKISVENIEVVDALYGIVGNSGEYNVEVSMGDKLGNLATLSDSIKIDLKAPLIEQVQVKWVDGEDGKTYIESDDGKISFKVVDTASGVKSVKVLSGDNELPISSSNGVYEIDLSGLSEVTPVFCVEDNNGNEKRYSLKDVLGCSNDTAVLGLPLPVVDYSVTSGEKVSDWYKGSTINLTSSISNNVGGISKVVYQIGTGSEVEKTVNGKECTITENIANYADDNGIVDVKITVYDKNSNSFKYDTVYKVDNVAPKLENISVVGKYNTYDKIAYSSDGITISGKQVDSESGVKKLEVLRGTEVVSTGLPYNIETSGDYSVKLVDNANNTKVYSLSDLFGSDINSIVISNNAPKISVNTIEGGVKVGDINWYKSVDSVSYSFECDNFLSTEVSVKNGGNSSALTSVKGTDGSYYVSLKDLKEGINTITFKVKDKSGLESSENLVIGIDSSKPIVSSIKSNISYKDVLGFLWFKESPTVTVSASDSLTEVKEYIVIGSDGERTEKSKEFKLYDGDYAIKVKDSLGNVSNVIKLKDTWDTEAGIVAIDGEKPKIDCARPDGDVKGWYSDDVTFKANLSDNSGINNAKMIINDVEVDSVNPSKGTLTGSLTGSTSGISPNDDGSYDISAVVTDNAGNSVNWSDTIYIDKEAPTIDKFVITSIEDGYYEGKNINGSDKYGFYLKDVDDIEVHVSDGDVSSGMKEVKYTFRDYSGKETSGTVKIESGVATITDIPRNFKGFISAYAVDNVGNKGKSDKPDGFISESGNTHINNSKISMSLPKTSYTDKKGYNLYNKSIKVAVAVKNGYSGIRKVEWGVGDETRGTLNIDNNGNISGGSATVTKKDKNLIISLEEALKVSDNSNNLNIWVRTTDRVGHESEVNRIVSIDKDNPVISVSYDKNVKSGYYDSNRVATISIKDRNFTSKNVRLRGNYGKISKWSYAGDDTWVATMAFTGNKEYQWGIFCTDRAGNTSNRYTSEKFIIDKIAPEVKVSFDNNNAKNSMYYDKGRVATVKVVEKNFDPRKVKLVGDGKLVGWSSKGNVHTAKIYFREDGEYSFSLVAYDKSGNASSKYSSGKFIIDKTKPTISISGVKEGVSYKDNLSFTVSIKDKYLDKGNCTATLIGRSGGRIPLKASIDEKTGRFVFSGLPKEKKYDDLYTLKVSVKDKAGNSEEESLVFSINRFGSQYKFMDTHLLKNIVGEAVDVDLEETSVDRLDLKKCKVVVIRDGNKISIDKKYISIKEIGGVNGPWVYKYHIDKEAFNVDGKYQIQVFSEAKDGTDYSSIKQEYYFLLDTTEPEIIVSGVKDDEFYKGVSRKVSIDIRDISGADIVEAVLNGDKVELSNDEGVYYLNIPEKSTRQDLNITVVDKAGNSSSVRVVDFMVSSSTLQSIIHSDWFKWVAGVAAVLVAGLMGLIVGRRRKSKKEERVNAEETARMYEESNTGGSGSGK